MWFDGDVSSAVAEAKRNSGVFVAFVTDDSEEGQQMERHWNEQTVIDRVSALNGRLCSIRFTADSSTCEQFLAAFPQATPPCSLFFDTRTRTVAHVIKAPSSVDELLTVIESQFPQEQEPEQVEEQNQAKASEEAQATTTARSLKERQEDMLAKIKRAQEQKRQAQQEEEKRKELARREQTKAMQSAQRKFEEEQTKRYAAERQKEKLEERKRREEVRRRIAEDRERQKQQQQQQQQQPNEQNQRGDASTEPTLTTTDSTATTSTPADYKEALLSLRLPAGDMHEVTLPADAPMRELYDHVRANLLQNISNPFVIRQPYPVKSFDANDEQTLRSHGLVPRARLLVQIMETPPRPPSVCDTIVEMIKSFFRSPPSPSVGNQASQPSRPTSSTTSSSSQVDVGDLRRRRVGRLAGLNNPDDNDRNEAYNGNSTQFQM